VSNRPLLILLCAYSEEKISNKLSQYCTTKEHCTSAAARKGESIGRSRYSHSEARRDRNSKQEQINFNDQVRSGRVIIHNTRSLLITPRHLEQEQGWLLTVQRLVGVRWLYQQRFQVCVLPHWPCAQSRFLRHQGKGRIVRSRGGWTKVVQSALRLEQTSDRE